MADKKKILIIRLGAIGDVVMGTVIASSIKLKHPDYEVHYLTQIEIAPVLENHPHIDKIIPWNTKNRKSLRQLFQTGTKLFFEHYDIVFNLTYALRNITLSFMTCSKKIVFKRYSQKSWVEDFFYTAQTAVKDIDCPSRLYLGLISECRQKIESFTEKYPRPYIVIAPGGETDKNRMGRIWNIENWKVLIENLLKIYGGTVFIAGSEPERSYHEKISGKNIVICTGKLNIAESSALFSKADLMLSGDSGPIHIASAHNVKTLVLLGSTSPDKIKPYGENGYFITSDYECKYCWNKKCTRIQGKYAPCMEHITVESVLKKIEEEQLLYKR